MAVFNQALSNKKRNLSGIISANAPRPPRSAGTVEKVQVIDVPVVSVPPQPTNADLLKAINDLGNKIHQLSKNQQILESRLDNLKKTADAIDSNVIAGAEWLWQWIWWLDWDVTVTQDTGVEGTIPPHVHWK